MAKITTEIVIIIKYVSHKGHTNFTLKKTEKTFTYRQLERRFVKMGGNLSKKMKKALYKYNYLELWTHQYTYLGLKQTYVSRYRAHLPISIVF